MKNKLVKLQRRHRDMVENGQKLKKGRFPLQKPLLLRCLLMVWYKKREKIEKSDVVAAIVKNVIFLTFFRKLWKFLSEKSGSAKFLKND